MARRATLMLGAVQAHRHMHESTVPALVLVFVCVGIAAQTLGLAA